MRLLASPHPSTGRLVPAADLPFTLLLVAWLVGTEVIGRLSSSDMQDGLAIFSLGFAIALTAARHRRRPLPWVSWLIDRASRLADRVERLKYDHGIDLRGSPPIRRKTPRAVWSLVAGMIGWAVVAGVAWYLFPGGWRPAAVHTFYLGYLVVLTAVWAGLLACVVAGVYLPVILLDDMLQKWFPKESDRRGADVGLFMAYILSIVAVAACVPTAVILGLCLAVVAAACVAAARKGGPDPAILWRTGPGKRVYAAPLHRLLAGAVALTAGLVFNLLLTACGGGLFGQSTLSESMPVTMLLGAAAAWLSPGAALLAAIKVLSGLRDDPARFTPLALQIRGDDKSHVWAAAKLALRWNWRVRPVTSQPDAADVCVEVVPADQSEATEFEPRWPLKVSVTDLSNENVKDRLFRRDEIQLRRRIARGIATLFKRPAGEGKKKRGGGYWFAPHWWFVDSLGREEPDRGKKGEETPLRPFGTPYTEVFGPRARQHLYRVFRATQVDMVFIEDGIGHRSLERVLRALYELYDVHGGKRKAEDHHFRGVPKVKVMIHDYTPGSRFKATGYKELSYDELSRARVLHVFKDRGGQEELEDVPFDESWEPAPALGVG